MTLRSIALVGSMGTLLAIGSIASAHELCRLGLRVPDAVRRVVDVGESGAERIHRDQFVPAKENHARREAAIPVDPIANRLRVVAPKHAGPSRALDLPSFAIEHPSRMEPETCTLRHADPAARYRPQQQRAGRVAGSIDNDALAGLPQVGEAAEIFVDPSTGVLVNS